MNYPLETSRLQQAYTEIDQLRAVVDQNMDLPLDQRDPSIRDQWFLACTDYIELVIEKVKNLGLSAYHNPITTYHSIIIDTIYFRTIVGHESSILTAAITSQRPISQEDFSNFIYLRGRSDQIWQDVLSEMEMVQSPALENAVEQVQVRYYDQFRSTQQVYISKLLADEIEVHDSSELAAASIPALDTIFVMVDAALAEIEHANQINMRNSYFNFMRGLLGMLLVLLLILYLPFYLRNKLVRPLNKIIMAIEELSAGNTKIDVDTDAKEDEIGKLMTGVLLLKRSIEKEQGLTTELRQVVTNLEDISTKDHLTGLYNRRYINAKLMDLEDQHKVNKKPFTLIICDIDHFKRVNDKYGHECGDQVLIGVTDILTQQSREQDIPARWGGEEFVILLPETDTAGAEHYAKRVQQALKETVFQYKDAKIKITMTFGIASYDEAIGITGTIKQADLAMLTGKKQGRNRIINYQETNINP